MPDSVLDPTSTLKLRNYLYDTLGWPRVPLPPADSEDEGESVEEAPVTDAQRRQRAEDDVPAFRADNSLDEDDQVPIDQYKADFEHDPQDTRLEVEDVDSQVLRNAQYITFDGEAGDDYTQGPARMVLASDGVQDCVALLMRLDLSQYIQQAVYAQRSYYRKQSQVDEQLSAIERFQRKVRREIGNQRIRIDTEQEVLPGDESKVVDQNLVSGCEQKIEVLEAVLHDMDRRRVLVEATVREAERSLKEALETILAYLEDAMVDSRLVPAEDEEEALPVEDFDLETEYRAMAHQLNGGDEQPVAQNEAEPTEDLGFGDEFYRHRLPTPTPEQQAIAELQQAVIHAKEHRQEAQAEFDQKESSQDRDKWENWQSYASTEDFDVHWVQRNREITHQLVEAEELYAQAKAAAIGAGAPRETVCSGYGSDIDYADYPLSHEVEEGHIEALRPLVNSWMEKVVDVADPETQGDADADVDEWEVDELDIGDSISCVDMFRYRSEIDRWRQQVLSDPEKK